MRHGESLHAFKPQRGDMCQPRATPWDSCHAPPPPPKRRNTSKSAQQHPTRRVPPYPPSHSHGCTRGWYAVTLWVKPNPIPRVAPWAGMRGPFGSNRTRFPWLHPGLVCVDPLGQTEPDSQGCTLGWYAVTLWVTPNPIPRVAPWAGMRGPFGSHRTRRAWLLSLGGCWKVIAAWRGPSRVQAPTGLHVITQGDALGFM